MIIRQTVSEGVFVYPVVKMKKIFIIALMCVSCPYLLAQETDSKVSPLYFGPNAMPVPEMLDGVVYERLHSELAFDLHKGYHGDLTGTVYAELNIPLFSPRVNLSLWMPVVEFYSNTAESLAWQDSPGGGKTKGSEFGNLYISTDIQLLKQTRTRPDIVIRAAIVTASGDSEEYARYYDAPGYFFDASIAKSVDLGQGFFRSLRFIANGGFLCWQTGKSVQNDAYMYGLKIRLDTRVADLSAAWQGYTGWQDNGDRPMVFRAEAVFNAGRLHPLLAFEHGIRDYPFNHFRIGLGYIF